MPMLRALAAASIFAPRNKNSQPYFFFWRLIIARTSSAVKRRLAFSMPSVVMMNSVCSGTSSERADLCTLPMWRMAPPTAS